MELVARLLEYTPSLRMTPLQACAHAFFNELRDQNTRLPSGRVLPPLFNFTEGELRIQPALNSLLLPAYMQSESPDRQEAASAAAAATAAAGASGNSSDNSVNSSTPSTSQNSDPNQSNMS